MVSLRLLAVLSATCCVVSVEAVPAIRPGAVGNELPADPFRVNIHPPTLGEADDDDRQLSPATQSFLATLGTALGPIVGAIVGPLLANIGQNLSAGSGAEALTQLQQAAQAAVAAQQQQQQQQQQQGGVGGAGSTAGVGSTGVGSTGAPAPTAQSARPTARPPRPSRPSARPARPRPARPVRPVTPGASPSRPQSFDAFVLDVPGRGPFLFLMAANLSGEEQTAAIQQAQQQAAQLFGTNAQGSPSARPLSLTSGAAASLANPPAPAPAVQPLATKPTSAGPLPARPGGSAPLPSYHSLLDEDADEEVAVADDLPSDITPTGRVQVQTSAAPTVERQDDDNFSSSLDGISSSLDRFFSDLE